MYSCHTPILVVINMIGWLLLKTKARPIITAPEANMEEPFQDDEILQLSIIDVNVDVGGTLQYDNGQ